ncbi:DUF1697 domain-containing protein [Pseudooceanicola sp. C21-150M6]
MRWIVLLRGVNVGGHGKLPMKPLKSALETAGAQDVATYIQSGNLVFTHDLDNARNLADWTSDLIAAEFGHRPPALALTAEALRNVIAANPFPQAAEPKFMTFHLFDGTVDMTRLTAIRTNAYDGEEIAPGDGCLYHWPPRGIGKSKIAQKIPAAISGVTTARNLNTLRAVLDLA